MMLLNPYSILKRARKLLEKGWCQKEYAQDKDGNYAPLKSRKAVAFCMIGATQRAAGGLGDEAEGAQKYLREVLPLANNRGIVSYNDAKGRKKEQVLAVFDKAIALAQKESV